MRFQFLLAPAAAIALAGCTMVFGGVETCGRRPAGGGPAAIVTQEEQLCEVVRLRVIRALDGAVDLTPEKIETLLDKSGRWDHNDTVDEVVAAIRRDAGDAVADEVKHAVDSVMAQSSRAFGADCGGAQKCMAVGAAKGARIAMLTARPSREAVVPMTGPSEK